MICYSDFNLENALIALLYAWECLKIHLDLEWIITESEVEAL